MYRTRAHVCVDECGAVDLGGWGKAAFGLGSDWTGGKNFQGNFHGKIRLEPISNDLKFDGSRASEEKQTKVR